MVSIGYVNNIIIKKKIIKIKIQIVSLDSFLASQTPVTILREKIDFIKKEFFCDSRLNRALCVLSEATKEAGFDPFPVVLTVTDGPPTAFSSFLCMDCVLQAADRCRS